MEENLNVNKDALKNNSFVLMLGNGLYIIGKLIEEINGDFELEYPTVILPTKEGKVNLAPFLQYSTQKKVSIIRSSVLCYYKPSEELLNGYINNIEKIFSEKVPKIIMPNDKIVPIKWGKNASRKGERWLQIW